MNIKQLENLTTEKLILCSEGVARALLSFKPKGCEVSSVQNIPQFINKDLLKIKTFLGSPYKEMIYKFQTYNFDENVTYIKNVPQSISLEMIDFDGKNFGYEKVETASLVKGSDSASLFMLMQESPVLCHLIAQQYYKQSGVELNLKVSTHLAIGHIVEELVALERKYNFKNSVSFLENLYVQELVACFDRFMNFTMNGFEQVLHFDESKLYETIHAAYEMTEGVKSTPKSLREMWMFEWETNVLPNLPLYQPSDILKILSILQMNFIDTDVDLYEDKESLSEISDVFYMNMYKHVFAGIQSSPWVQAAL